MYYKDLPLKIELISTSILPTTTGNPNNPHAEMSLIANVGRANLQFIGTTTDMKNPRNFSGKFNLSGSSLAAVGDLIGVTFGKDFCMTAYGRK